MHLIFTGPTNAGKSTQATHIARAFPDIYESIDVGAIVQNNLAILPTQDILRT